MHESTQQRLLDAGAEGAIRHGYADLTVDRVLQLSGVSRASFYQCYSGIEGWFVDAYRHYAEHLVSVIEIEAARSDRPLIGAIRALTDLACARPGEAQLLMTEGLAGGPVLWAERDRLISDIRQAVASRSHKGPWADLPLQILFGGLLRYLGLRLAEDSVGEEVGAELLAWCDSFNRQTENGWSELFAPALPAERQLVVPKTTDADWATLPARERILRATAVKLCERPYSSVTVGEIVAAACVSRRHFYNEFPNKQAAAIAMYEMLFERLMAESASGFFQAESWPDRVWGSALAFTRCLSREPFLAYAAFTEAFGFGRHFSRRVYSTLLAFTIFLEQGYRYSTDEASHSHGRSILTACFAAEAGFQAARRGPSVHMKRMQPLVVYAVLTPFLGVEAAGTFVAEKLNGSQPFSKMVRSTAAT